MFLAIHPSREFIRAEFDFPLRGVELGAQGHGKLALQRRGILFHAPTTGANEFSLNRATENEIRARTKMEQGDLQGARQAVFRLVSLGKNPIEFAHLFNELEFSRRGFNVINGNFHNSVGVPARAHGSMNPAKKQRRQSIQESS